MNFIKRANLPSKKVKYIVCDCRIKPEIEMELLKYDISIIKTKTDDSLQLPVCGHADIHMFHFGGEKFITSKKFNSDFSKAIYNIKEIDDCEIFNNACYQKELRHDYPNDVPLNAVKIGEYIICNPKTVCDEIKADTNRIITTKQGYTKCSVVPVESEAIITDDTDIYNSAKNYIDVLLVKKGYVKLNGYNYGFIGGCSGKLSNDILAFSGNIDKCIEASNIKAFCKNHGVECISLSSEDLYDYGSLIPILE